MQLREYVPIIRDKPRYPLIVDANNVVCSLPPIINSKRVDALARLERRKNALFIGEHSKITLKTKNIFIEATATDLRKAEIVLDTLVTMFSSYCKTPFTVEPVMVIYDDARVPPTVFPVSTSAYGILARVMRAINVFRSFHIVSKQSISTE